MKLRLATINACILSSLTLGLHACTSVSSSATMSLDSPWDDSSAAPPAGKSLRIGGDRAAAVRGTDGAYRAGRCSISTPLPVGYPRPTPPNAIELKTYPVVRMAEVSGSGNPDAGMNSTFWPLFNHIKGHDIAMTAPVEMNFRDMPSSERPSPGSWSMAFLYRQPELNSTGVEGRVTVRDSEPVTVVAIGLKGNYAMSLVQRGMREIEAWLTANPGWKPAGAWRALYYNGPSLFWWNKWAEVQLPVQSVSGPSSNAVETGRAASGARP